MTKKLFNAIMLFLVLTVFSGVVVWGCPIPTVISLSTNHGLNTDIIDLAVNGAKFDKSAFVRLTKTGEPDIIADNNKVLSKTELTCTLNLKGKTTGVWNVIVSNIGTFTKKEKPTIIADGFTIEAAGPSISGIEPHQGLNNTIISITNLSGTDFRSGAAVMLSNSQMDIGATKIVVVSATQITCQFNLTGSKPGTYHVKVINDDNKVGLLTNGFQVIALATPTPTATPTPIPTPQITPTPLPDPTATPLPGPVIKAITPDKGFNNGAVLVNIDGFTFLQTPLQN